MDRQILASETFLQSVDLIFKVLAHGNWFLD